MKDAVTAMLPVLAGPAIWAGQFVAVYGIQACACAAAAAPPVGALLLAISCAAAGLCLAMAVRLVLRDPGGEDARSLRRMALLAHGLSIIAIVWTAAAVLMIRPCGI